MIEADTPVEQPRWKKRVFAKNPVMRWSLQASVVLVTLVTFPALFARQWADERFVMYMPESLVGSHPWKLFSTVYNEIPSYIEAGVFRPVSVFLFYLEHWIVVRFGASTGIPPHVVMAAVKVAAVSALVAMVMMTIDQYRRASGGKAGDLHWRRLYVLTAMALGLSLVLYNPATHPLTLFPGLYLGTAAVALGIPLWFGRSWLRYRAGEPISRMWVRVAGAVIVGAVVASMIELAYLAIPLGLVHLVLLSFAAGDTWKSAWLDLFHSEAFLLWALVVAGFVVVFVPARAAIADTCARYSCYRAAELSLGGDAISTWPVRAAASFFPIPLGVRSNRLIRIRNAPEMLLLATVAAAFVGYFVRKYVFPGEDHARTRTPRVPMLLLGAYFAVVVFLGTMVSTVSGAVQDKGWDVSPWRESGFTWVGWAVVIGLILTMLFHAARHARYWAVALAAVMVATVFVTSIVNQADIDRVRSAEDSRLYNEAGLLLVNFDNTPAGDAERCGVLVGLRDFAKSDSEAWKARRLGNYLNDAANNIYSVDFCSEDFS